MKISQGQTVTTIIKFFIARLGVDLVGGRRIYALKGETTPRPPKAQYFLTSATDQTTNRPTGQIRLAVALRSL